MSIAVGNNRVEQISGGFLRRQPPYNLPPILDSGDRKVVRMVVKEGMGNGYLVESCSSSSSSIGMNSDDEKDGEFDDESEVQSKFKSNPFDSAVDALEQALPVRRGISSFYNGKSKSFASLTDAACSSIEEITKPENAYSRKRKNLLAYNLLCDNGRSSLVKGPGIGGGVAKRPTNSSRSRLALAVAMNNCETSADEYETTPETNGRNNTRNMSPSSPLSPLPPVPWRSFSLADLQHYAVSASVVNSNLSSPLMRKRTKPDEVS